VMAEEQKELSRRELLYRGDRPRLVLADKVVILADDGLATGSTMLAAVRAARALGPSRVVVAAPVGSAEACEKLEQVADEVVCARIPRWFSAVGQWYLDFSDTSDQEVRVLLQHNQPDRIATEVKA
jgi:putative phosphoribosyl transferase